MINLNAMPFTLDDISIAPSRLASAGKWKMQIEVSGFRYTGFFSDFGGFLTAVTDAAQFFAVRTGRMKLKDAKTTRPLAPMAN
jgi:hypothetical protein